MRILIVKLSSIGDVVHTLPAVALLKRSLPQARISWAVERRASAILKDCPVIDELIEIDSRTWRRQWHSSLTLRDINATLSTLRGNGQTSAPNNGHSGQHEPFDAAIDFQGLIKSGVVSLASGARSRFGFETCELREKPARLFLTEQVATSQLKHVIEKNLALARRLLQFAESEMEDRLYSPKLQREDEPPEYEFPISLSPGDEEYAKQVIREARFAIINPGGGWSTKLCSPSLFGHLADWLHREHDLKSFVTYGPGEEERAHSVVSSSRTGAAAVLPSTLKQFVAIARRAELFLGGDTGPLHLAAACGTPIVGLYGPTSPDRNGPFDPLDITVGRDLWCRADCYKRACWHWECMEIPAGEIERALARRLESAVQGKKSAREACARATDIRNV